jgi:uncharacterized membrane protein
MTEEERDRLLKSMREGRELELTGRRRTDKDHSLALWAGLTALFTNLAAVQVVILLGRADDARVQALGALITALIVAAATYARQRRDDLRDLRDRAKSQ